MAFFLLPRWHLMVALLIFLAFASPLPQLKAQPAEQTAIEQSVQQMFAAFARQDMQEVKRLWITTEPQFQWFEKFALQSFSHSTNTQFVNPVFTRWKIEA